MFESLVNTEGIQTNEAWQAGDIVFESLVNTEGIQTDFSSADIATRLRVLLIRKEFKRSSFISKALTGLRVLLIRKEFKPKKQLESL